MTEAQFWNLIALLDWNKTSTNEIRERLVCALEDLPETDLYGFEETLSRKLFALDRVEIAMVAFNGDPHFSGDGFLYARCFVVAQGKEFFDSVDREPQKMPVRREFEALLNVASLAYKRNTGKEFEYFSSVDYETRSNKAGWDTG